MTDSFLHNHQSALDSQREDDAIQYLQDCGVYPDPKYIEVGDLVNIEFDILGRYFLKNSKNFTGLQ